MKKSADYMLNRSHPQPVAATSLSAASFDCNLSRAIMTTLPAVNERRASLELLDKEAEKSSIIVLVNFLDTSLRYNAAVVCLRSRLSESSLQVHGQFSRS